MFLESKALSPEEKKMRLIHEAMVELKEKGEKVNQRSLILHLSRILGRDKIVELLEKGEGKYWDSKPGNRKEIVYEPKTLKKGYIYNQGFRVLENREQEDYEIPEELR